MAREEVGAVLGAVLLALVAQALIHHRAVLAAESGFYSVTDDAYENMAIHVSQYTGAKLLQLVRFPPGYDRQEMLLLCLQRCVTLAACRSYVITDNYTKCYLNSYDRCAKPYVLLYHQSGVRTFDVLPAPRPHPLTTCYSSCNGTCDDCGRQNCRGEACEVCARYCWHNITKDQVGSTLLWTETKALSYSCDQGWHRVWAGSFSVYSLLWQPELVLQLRVLYAGGSILRSYFPDFQVNSGKISVGSFLDGNAGNFWEAPFANRPAKAVNDCLPFFYPPSLSDCEPAGGPNVSAQWLTGDDAFDNLTITKIELWIIPRQSGVLDLESLFTTAPTTVATTTAASTTVTGAPTTTTTTTPAGP